MSPDRRVSWPTTIAPPPARRAGARSPARGRRRAVGFRSTLATPRMPSVPNSRGTAVSRRLGAGDAATEAGATTVTVTVGGSTSTSVRPAGRSTVTGTSVGRSGAGDRPTSQVGHERRRRSGGRGRRSEPPIVTQDAGRSSRRSRGPPGARRTRRSRRRSVRRRGHAAASVDRDPDLRRPRAATTPSGRSSADGRRRRRVTPVIETGSVSALVERGERVGVALDGDDGGSTVTLATSKPAAGVPVEDRRDRQRPATRGR